MSILAAAATTQPAPPGGEVVFVTVVLLVGLSIAAAAGVFRSGSVRGPDRLDPAAPRGPLWFVMIAGVFLWLAAQIVIGANRRSKYEATGATRPFELADLTAMDYALLATAPGVAGLLVILVGDVLVGRNMLRRLGLTLRQFIPGVLKGIVGILILMPVILFASYCLTAFYKWVGFEHPSEHDLLRIMNETGDGAHRVLMIVGATLVAPAFEEIVFRGHLQTLLVGWFDSVARRMREPVAVVTTDVAEIPAGPPAGPIAVSPSTPRPVWRLWLAIAITSLVFAGIHPGWTVPVIFVLSLGLGYAYERTGNLWVPLTIHLLFNTLQTTFFLFSRQGQN